MNPEIESKSIQFKLDESGKVSAVIAQFGVVDKDDDIVEPTAFRSGQEVAIVWSHDWSAPVGKGVITVTSEEAIFEGTFFMDTDRGQEAYKTVKAMGTLQEWSWGFRTVKSTWEQRGDQMIRHLIETDVYEVSPVLKGAGIGTRTLAIKGQTLDTEISSLIEAADSLGERVRSLKGMRATDGREISDARCSEIKELAERLEQTAEKLKKSLEKETVIDRQREFNKFQKFRLLHSGVRKDQ